MPVVPPQSHNSQKDKDTTIDTGLACLVMIARFHQVAVDGGQLAHYFGSHEKLFDANDLVRAARHLKLKSRSSTVQFQQLEKIALKGGSLKAVTMSSCCNNRATMRVFIAIRTMSRTLEPCLPALNRKGLNLDQKEGLPDANSAFNHPTRQ